VLHAYAGGRIFGTTYGEGPVQVLGLHGWARSSRDFDGVFGGLGAVGAVAVDLPGFGASPPPPVAWGTDDYAEALLPVMDELVAPTGDDGGLVVVGHSFGGKVAVQLAASHPERVRALVLIGVPLLRPGNAAAPGPALAYRVGRALHRRGLIGERRMEALRRRHGSADYVAASGVMRQVLVRTVAESFESQLRVLSCPVELVWGEADEVIPLPVARAAAALCRSATVVTCPGAGHLTLTAAPDCVRAAVERRLQPA
jgi:pimeloyl-ACP methyl ester carboxylesterase